MADPNPHVTENPPNAPPSKPVTDKPAGGGTATAIAEGPPKPTLPPKPAPPAKPPAKAKAGKSRRFFLFTWFGAGMAALAAAMAGMAIWTLRFLVPNVNSEPPATFKAGEPSSYSPNEVRAYKENGAWVVRSRDEKGRDIIYALSTTCTHLGCTPNWLEDAKKFKCPCHGSGFYITGVNFEGPAPRPLERYSIKPGTDGLILVDKTKKFQKELGQWENPESYIQMS